MPTTDSRATVQETRLLASDYASVYTTPDTTNNRATFVNGTLRRSLPNQIAVSFSAYSFVDAAYQSDEIGGGSNNSSNLTAAAGGKDLERAIAIHAGDRIPLIRRQTFKGYADVRATTKLSLDLGPGRTPAYAVLNAGVRYAFMRRIEAVVQVDSVFNARYYTAAQLGPTGFTSAGTFVARPLPSIGGEFPVARSTFFAPGTPATLTLSVRFSL